MEEAGQVNSARAMACLSRKAEFLQAAGWDQVTGLETLGREDNELPRSRRRIPDTIMFSDPQMSTKVPQVCLLGHFNFSAGILDSLPVFVGAVILYAFS